MDFLIAWRNLWRNTRRTAVVLAAVTTGIWALIFILAFGRGFMVDMVDNAIDTLTGHIQIHAEGYLDRPDIDHSMETEWNQMNAVFAKVLPEGSKWSQRIRINAVVSNARHSGGVTLVGSDWKTEKSMTFLEEAHLEGEEPANEDPYSIVVGRALMEKFETKIGNKLILMAQDTTGEVASRAFVIRAVFDTEMESVEKQFAFVSKNAAEKFLTMPGQLSEISIMLPDSSTADDQIKATVNALKSELDPDLDIQGWMSFAAINSRLRQNHRKNELYRRVCHFHRDGFRTGEYHADGSA